jgi:hypothetical protein
MATQIKLGRGALILAEMQEFASFGPDTQYYVRRSLDAAFAPELAVDRWARSDEEAASIRAQSHIYRALPLIRGSIPIENDLASADTFLFALMSTSIFDLSGVGIAAFPHYRFLYERLLGAAIRPWLPSAFAAAAALPHLIPKRRHVLLTSMGGAWTDRWSSMEPGFYPDWLAR